MMDQSEGWQVPRSTKVFFLISIVRAITWHSFEGATLFRDKQLNCSRHFI
jgi:hypothetical protein